MKIFNSIASMALATLAEGTFVETYGSNDAGDVSAARYYIEEYSGNPGDYDAKDVLLPNNKVAVFKYYIGNSNYIIIQNQLENSELDIQEAWTFSVAPKMDSISLDQAEELNLPPLADLGWTAHAYKVQSTAPKYQMREVDELDVLQSQYDIVIDNNTYGVRHITGQNAPEAASPPYAIEYRGSNAEGSRLMSEGFKVLTQQNAAELLTGVTAGSLVGEIKDVITQNTADRDRWLLVDNRVLLQADEPLLFAELGIIFNEAGDNDLTEFRLPPQGYFKRNAATTADVDPDGPRTSGSIQEDEFAAHTHDLTQIQNNSNILGNNGFYDRATGSASSLTTDSTGGDETRPKNIAVHWFIYAGAAPE